MSDSAAESTRGGVRVPRGSSAHQEGPLRTCQGARVGGRGARCGDPGPPCAPGVVRTGAGRRGASAGLEGCGSAFALQRRIATDHTPPKRPTVSGTEGRARSADAPCPAASPASGSGVTLNVKVPETRAVACRSTNRPEKGEERFRGPPALLGRTEVGGGSKWGRERPSWAVERSWQCQGQGCAPWAVLEGPESTSVPGHSEGTRSGRAPQSHATGERL